MDISGLKKFARLIVVDKSRRGMLKTAATGAAASALAGIGLTSGTVERAAAKKKKKRCEPNPLGSPCSRNKDCCCETNRICSTPCEGIPGVTPSVCCGSKGASCSSESQCCFSFECNPVTGKCQEGPC